MGAPPTTTFPLLPALYIRILFKISGFFFFMFKKYRSKVQSQLFIFRSSPGLK